jgi:hypothetical protein
MVCIFTIFLLCRNAGQGDKKEYGLDVLYLLGIFETFLAGI